MDPTHAWMAPLDQALQAMAGVAADLDAAGFGGLPFSVEVSDATLKATRGGVLFLIRKPDLRTAHHTLLWTTTHDRARRALEAQAGPFLHGLRSALPVLTGPRGSVALQHLRGGVGLDQQTFVCVNGHTLTTPNTAKALGILAQRVAHLHPTSGGRINRSGYIHPMMGATTEEDDVFRTALADIGAT